MKINYIPNRVIDMDGIADGAEIHVYQTGTSTPVNLYIDSNYATPVSNPYIVAAGAAVPPLYANATSIRVVIVTDNGTEDYDPYDPLSLGITQTVTPQQFGAVADGITDDSTAFVSAIAYLKTLGVNKDTFYQGSPKLFIPSGLYNMGTTTLDITHTLIIEGESSINGYSSLLKWSGNATGIRIQAYNTSGDSSVVAGGFNSGSYTIIRNLGLAGPYYNNNDFTGHTEGEYHGIHARSNYIIEDCDIDGFAGDGVHVLTSSGGGGANEGNSNCSFINRLHVTNVRNGVFIDGADSNAGTFTGIVGTYCRRWTVWDSSFLGNIHIGHHSANAGLVKGVAPCIVVQGGNRYAVIAGQEAGASTNAPSGTTADNTWWLYLAAGAADATLNIAAWVSGTTYRAGGCYHTDSANAANQMIGLYDEGGEGVAQFISPTNTIGGLWGTRDPVTTGNYYTGSKIVAPNVVTLGPTRVVIGNSTVFGVHNSNALAGGLYASVNLQQGLETDGVTPANLGAVTVRSSTNNPATAEGTMEFWTRTFGGTGGMTARCAVDGSNLTFRPAADNNMDLGTAALRWKGFYAYTLIATTSVTIGAGTPITKIVVYTPTLTPASVAAATVAEQTFTVTGLTTADTVSVNCPSIANATGIAGVRVSAADTLAIRFVNPTAGALTPTSGVYRIIAHRS